MLNDLSRPTRLLVAGFGLALGLMIGGPGLGEGSGASWVLLFGGLLVEVVVIGAFPALLGRAERRFRVAVDAGTGEIARGEVVPVPAAGRVVRARADRRHGWFLPVRGAGPAPSSLTVLVALADGADGVRARRVAALVPPDLDLGHGGPALLLVHPVRRDVAVLDDRVTPDALVAVDADPRWTTQRLPTDRTVVGGYLALVAAAAAGVAAGFGLAALVLTVW
ncbi:hypothetical protein [Nocardioides dongxiaopingii]|uniref:hypothetical protein n=1 Tax=Nocardioides dongxiaopingii TaxID=2576036 RepID=UPI0010C76838|nr:hypothetical protein [Nocardioides dongxiaopingii]